MPPQFVGRSASTRVRRKRAKASTKRFSNRRLARVVWAFGPLSFCFLDWQGQPFQCTQNRPVVEALFGTAAQSPSPSGQPRIRRRPQLPRGPEIDPRRGSRSGGPLVRALGLGPSLRRLEVPRQLVGEHGDGRLAEAPGKDGKQSFDVIPNRALPRRDPCGVGLSSLGGIRHRSGEFLVFWMSREHPEYRRPTPRGPRFAANETIPDSDRQKGCGPARRALSRGG